jgi:hypothetical protein
MAPPSAAAGARSSLHSICGLFAISGFFAAAVPAVYGPRTELVGG